MSDPQAIFFEAFDGLERLAPGSEASTLRALRVVRQRLDPGRILDVGCGTGAQTIALALNTDAEIVAVDSHAPYLAALEFRIHKLGLGSRVRVECASMLELGEKFRHATFDVLWIEGSIYVIGFDRGLEAWRGLLRDRGILACTELSWLTDAPSGEARRFWAEAYPAMRSRGANIDAAERAGWVCLSHFVLPASDWWDDYYAPLEARIGALRAKCAGDVAAAEVLGGLQAEIDLYRGHGGDYGYVFYVFQNAGVRA